MAQRSIRKALFFVHDFGYSFSFSSSLFYKEGREKGKRITKVVVKKQCFSARSAQNVSALKFFLILKIVFVDFRKDLKNSFWNYVSSLLSMHLTSFYFDRSGRFSQKPEPLIKNLISAVMLYYIIFSLLPYSDISLCCS